MDGHNLVTGDLICTGSLVHMQQFTAHLHVPGLLSLPATFTDYSATSRRTDVSGAAPALAGRSLWLLGEDHPVRVWLYDLVTARGFDYAMFALILLNCVTMAYEYPGMHKGDLDYTVLHWRWGTQRARGGAPQVAVAAIPSQFTPERHSIFSPATWRPLPCSAWRLR